MQMYFKEEKRFLQKTIFLSFFIFIFAFSFMQAEYHYEPSEEYSLDDEQELYQAIDLLSNRLLYDKTFSREDGAILQSYFDRMSYYLDEHKKESIERKRQRGLIDEGIHSFEDECIGSYFPSIVNFAEIDLMNSFASCSPMDQWKIPVYINGIQRFREIGKENLEKAEEVSYLIPDEKIRNHVNAAISGALLNLVNGRVGVSAILASAAVGGIAALVVKYIVDVHSAYWEVHDYLKKSKAAFEKAESFEHELARLV